MLAGKKSKKKWVTLFIVLVALLAGIQFIRPQLNNPPVTADLTAPAEVKQILTRACYDCHSNETKLKWFDEISPAYWLVADHVKKARKVLNFSEWDSLARPDQKAKLFESLNQIITGDMPIRQYTMLHPETKLSGNDISILKDYMRGLSPVKTTDTSRTNAGNLQYNNWINSATEISGVKPSLNGIDYMPDYKNWEAISTTDRFDNGTMRVIFGNAVAVKAIKEQQVNPWPDGTTFAKVAWDQLIDSSGNVTTGEFKQVEFMIKDSKKYAATEGWGFARWKGMQLAPYGKTVLFTTECVNCHKPMRDNDFVFTEPLNLKTK